MNAKDKTQPSKPISLVVLNGRFVPSSSIQITSTESSMTITVGPSTPIANYLEYIRLSQSGETSSHFSMSASS